MIASPLDEFVAYELNATAREDLLAANSAPKECRIYLTFNNFNVLLDFDASMVTVEGELDAERRSVVDLSAFARIVAEIAN